MFLIVALILFAIIFIARVANKWRVPLVIVSLLAGMLFGSDALKVINFDNYELAKDVANYALVFVLFIGGFGTKKERLKLVFGPAMVLATVGVIMTAAITVFMLVYVLKFDLQQSILISCIIASTDAAAVFSILRSRSLDPNLSSLVEIESATNDPMAIILTTVAVSLAVAHAAASELEQPLNLILVILDLLWQTVGGVGIGLLIGWGMVYISRFIAELDKGYYYIYIISIIMISYGVADAAKASGILSAFFAGFILGNSNIPYKSTSSTLLDALSTIGNVVIFVLLGLLVSPSDFNVEVLKGGVLLFLILAFVARPVTVAACTFFAKYSVKENVFISWSGLRGAVPIVLATYPAAAGIEGAKYIFNVVFFAVLLSLLIQGGTITKLADKLKLAAKARPKPRQVMELVNINTELELVEIEVDADVYEGEAELSRFRLPAGTTITMVNRDDNVIAPTGTTVIKPGDVLYVLVNAKEIGKAMNAIFSHFRSDKWPASGQPDWEDIELWR